MPVTVRTPSNNAYDFRTGTTFVLRDAGHLMILDDSEVVGVFAPGHWTMAEQSGTAEETRD
ncbi:hypothetical protein CFN78_18615 [Amycolatopsis antarctica]|uniref:Uncharacterized protein n=1 Tax=Amycolatopsis antarctica TaxID=1854586 RepID=A0A263D2H9_9PSEU|nr:hypothetical protein [Amycolatopsis antarctica]OZM71837.1 hypothetical protein CFN78_18615 [Amycolatopsis antarctica]